MLPKLIALAISSGLAKKAWDHYRTSNRKREPLVDITEVVARPAASNPAARRKAAKRREGPAS